MTVSELRRLAGEVERLLASKNECSPILNQKGTVLISSLPALLDCVEALQEFTYYDLRACQHIAGLLGPEGEELRGLPVKTAAELIAAIDHARAALAALDGEQA